MPTSFPQSPNLIQRLKKAWHECSEEKRCAILAVPIAGVVIGTSMLFAPEQIVCPSGSKPTHPVYGMGFGTSGSSAPPCVNKKDYAWPPDEPLAYPMGLEAAPIFEDLLGRKHIPVCIKNSVHL